MAGFMAGFGSGFSSAFERGYAMEKAKQENTFEKMYKTFETNKSYLDEYKTQDAKDVQAAKAILSQTPGMPGEALGEVYQKVKSIGYDDALKWAKAVKLEKTGTIPQQTDAAMDKGPQPSSVFAPVAPEAAGGGVMDKIKGGVDQLKYFGQKNVYEGQLKRMQEATGLPRKEVEKILALNKGGIPEDKEVAAASRNQFNAVPNPSAISPLDPTELAKMDAEIPNKMKDDVKDYRDREIQTASALGDISDMAKLVDQTEGAVLADGTSAFAQVLTGFAANVRAGVGLFSNDSPVGQQAGQIREQALAGADIGSVIAAQEGLVGSLQQQLEEEMKTNVGVNIEKLSTARTLLEQKTQLLAYKLAAMSGQTGRDVAVAEQQMFAQLAQGGNTPDKFKQNMAVLMNSKIAELQHRHDNLRNHPALIGYETATKRPYAGLEKIIGPNVMDKLKADPRAAEALGILEGYNNVNLNDKPAPGVTPPPQDTGQVQTVSSQEQYNSLPPGTRYRAPDGTVRTKGGQ